MAKVLHAGIFKDHELGGDIILEKGLLQNGCEVERFDYRVLISEVGLMKMYFQLIDRVRNKDILLIGKGEHFNSSILRDVKQMGVTVALWYGDIRPIPEQWLINILPEVDFFFMSSAGAVLKEYFHRGKPGVAAYYFNPSDPELAIKYSNFPRSNRNVVFTGTKYDFIGQERMQTIAYLKERGDVAFFGGADKAGNNSNIIERIRQKGSSKRLRGPEYIAAIMSACIGVGVNAIQDIPRYTSDRLTHYLTFGTFYMPWWFPQLDLLFEEGKEIVSFKDIEDLDRKIKYYLINSEEREKIAKAGQNKIIKTYNCKNIVGMMLDIISRCNSKRFPWVEIIS